MKETAYIITDDKGVVIRALETCSFLSDTVGFPIVKMFNAEDHYHVNSAMQKALQHHYAAQEPVQAFRWPGFMSVVRIGEELHWTFSFSDALAPEVDQIRSSLSTCEHELTVLRDDLLTRERSEQDLVARLDDMTGMLSRQRRRLETAEVDSIPETNKDPLTGALRKEVLEGELDRIMQEAAMASETIVVVRIDLNDFRRVRDKQGQEACNRILRLVSKSLIRNTRGRDRLIRFSPDEFVLLMVGITENEADTVITRLEKESRLVHTQGFSWGLSEWDPEIETIERRVLLARAEDKLQFMKDRVKSF